MAFDFYAGGGGAGLEDVFEPGHFFRKHKRHINVRMKTCDQISLRERPFDFYAGGGGAGLEDVFEPGHFFSL